MPSTRALKTPNFRTLDLNLLRVFDEVMAERSLTRAARNLSLTQPAVSNALRRLRDALDDELVTREGQGMAPTPRALVLWPTVRMALGQLQASLSPSNFEPATASTTFVLAMADATAAELMPGLIDIMEREAPGVAIRAACWTRARPTWRWGISRRCWRTWWCVPKVMRPSLLPTSACTTASMCA